MNRSNRLEASGWSGARSLTTSRAGSHEWDIGRLAAAASVPTAILLLVGPAWAGGVEPALLAWLAVFGALLGQAVSVDIRERRIPNALTYAGTLGAIVVAAFVGADAVISAGTGGALAMGLTGVAWWLGRGSLGLGDVKFSAMVGAFVGVGGVAPYLILGTGVGAILAVVVLASGRGRRTAFAYGPALAAGAVISVYTSSFTMAVG